MELITDRVLVLSSPKNENVGSIFVPAMTHDIRKETGKSVQGTIVLIGPGTKEHPLPDLKIGDKIWYSAWAGLDYEENGIKYLMMKFEDIIAKEE